MLSEVLDELDGDQIESLTKGLAFLDTMNRILQEGELRISGMDVRRQITDIRSNIGYAPQQLSIQPAFTGRQNVTWFARLYGVPRADRVDQALVAMDLLEVADRPASSPSSW